MKTVQYEKSEFGDYTLYFFYTRTKYDGEWCWLWDEDKLLLEDALKKYPPNKYLWEEVTEDL